MSRSGCSRCIVLACAFFGAALHVVADTVPTGYRPHPNPLTHHTNAPARVSASSRILRLTSTSLPSKYDLRDVDGKGTSYLSPVRQQGGYGTCWTFAAMAGIEYQMRRDEGLDADLSENNLAAMHGFVWGFDDGGNDLMASAVFLRHEAPVAEVLDPYANPATTFKGRGVRIPRKVIFLPRRSSVTDEAVLAADLAVLKNAVYKYGPVSSGYMHSSKYCNGAAYYCDTAYGPNHAIAIVGWDDDYPASSFKTAPPGNGAFIIRNSWGTGSSTDGGYNYISYYDATLGFHESTVFTSLSDGSDYGPIYQHDPYGYIGTYGYGDGNTTAAAMNMFTARTNETLTAFGFYAMCTGTTYRAYVVTDASVGYSRWYGENTLSGSATLVKSGTLEDAGYEVIDFDTDIDVSAGETFAVCVEMTTPLTDYPVPVTYNSDDYITNMTAEAGKSYIRSTYGKGGWQDISADGSYFCCKVYTKAAKEGYTTTSVPAVSYAWLDAYAKQQSGNYLTNCFYGAYNALADYTGANGYAIAESYARGLDPDSSATNLIATIKMESGKVVVEPSPMNTALWKYTVHGSVDLNSWHERTDGDRFFKITAAPVE